MTPSCEAKYKEVQLIFKGRAVDTGTTPAEAMAEYLAKGGNALNEPLPNTYTEFEILEVYKGLPDKKVRIYYDTGESYWESVKPVDEGKEMKIYASLRNGFYTTYFGMCSGGCDGDESIYLDTIKARYAALDALIKKHGAVREFYLKRAEYSASLADYQQAADTLRKLFAVDPEAAKDTALIVQLGRYLQLSGAADEAAKVLTGAKGSQEAAPYEQLSLISRGRIKELDGLKLRLAGQKLENVTLEGINIAGADFSGASLEKVRFINVNLQGADFSRAQMNSVDFLNADMKGAKWKDAGFQGNMESTNLEGADISGARLFIYKSHALNFNGADLSKAWLYAPGMQDSDLSNAKFIGATLHSIGGAKTTGADFTGANFFGMDMPGNRGNNKGIDLSGQKMDGATFMGGIFDGATFNGASLKKAIFTGAEVRGADFRGADLTGADFQVSHYHGPADVSGADFSTAIIKDVNWTNASYDCNTKFPDGFRPVKAGLTTKDTSCALEAEPAVQVYDINRLLTGYVEPCNGKYSTACLYAYAISTTLQINYGGNNDPTGPLALSLADAGYPELGRSLALRMIGAWALGYHSLSPMLHADWLKVLAKINMPDDATEISTLAQLNMVDIYPTFRLAMVEAEIASGRVDKAETAVTNFVKNLPLWSNFQFDQYNEHRRAAYPLARMFTLMAEVKAKSGLIVEAEKYARRIGDDEFLELVSADGLKDDEKRHAAGLFGFDSYIYGREPFDLEDVLTQFREYALESVARAAAQQDKTEMAKKIADKELEIPWLRSSIYYTLADRAWDTDKKDAALEYAKEGADLSDDADEALEMPIKDRTFPALKALERRATVEKKLGLDDALEETLRIASSLTYFAYKIDALPAAITLYRISKIAGKDLGEFEAFVRMKEIRNDYLNNNYLKEMAREALESGDANTARKLAILGLDTMKLYPAADAKTRAILQYADIIARTEEQIPSGQLEQLQRMLLELKPVPRNGQQVSLLSEAEHLAEEGERALSEMLRRAVLDDNIPTGYKVQGEIDREGGLYFHQWLTGARKKYQKDHPDEPLPPASSKFIGQNFGVARTGIILPTPYIQSGSKLIVPADVPRPKGPRNREVLILYLSDFTCEGDFSPYCKY